MEDSGLGEPVVGDLLGAAPDKGTGLAAAAQRAPPVPDDALPEGLQRAAVGRHGVVVEEARDDLLEPPALLGDGVVHALAQTFFDLLQLRPQPIAAAGSPQEKLAGPRGAADQGEAEEVEGLRFAQPAPCASSRGKATKLDQAGLVRMQRQRELLKPCAHCSEEPTGVGLVLEAGHHVIGITHDDHVASGFPPSPALGPQVEDVVQVDVGEQRRDHRSLPRPPVADRHRPIFEDARSEPFADQADDALVANPVFHKAGQPLLAHRVEERPDVGVQYPVHLPAGDPDHQGVERVVRSPSRPKPIREPEKFLLIDRVQHPGDGALDDLVLQSGNRQRPLPAICLRYVRPARRLRAVRAAMDAVVQICEPGLELRLVRAPRHPIHAGGGVSLQRVERLPQAVGIDVVQQRSEPFLLLSSCGSPYAVQRLGHAPPVQRPVRVVLARVPLGPGPSLLRLRPRSPGFVRQTRRYYDRA